MGERQSKKYSRMVKRTATRAQTKIINRFLDAAFGWPFKDRVKFAWAIVRGRVKCK